MKRQRDSSPLLTVVILERAGLWLGRDGIVDAYDKATSTEITNESLVEIRPDIVHQCLLALYDSDLAYGGNLRIYISTVKGKTISASPFWRPPRTYARFKGLMEHLLRDGSVITPDGKELLRILPGTVAPIIPNGATVIGLCNSKNAPVKRPTVLAREKLSDPVPASLQGGLKNVAAFVVVSCTEKANADDVDYVSESFCLSDYPLSPHVMCARLCEGMSHALEQGSNN